MKNLSELDQRYLWHPFTNHDTWGSKNQKIRVIESASGIWLTDTDGERYIDGNSSIWTNIHGHNHPHLNKAIQDQLAKVAHSSFLGFTHPNAILLAEKLIQLCQPSDLSRVFFSDNGSTAVEAAIKMELQLRDLRGESHRKNFIAFHHAYHGDTIGAASLGGVDAFFARFRSYGVKTHWVSDVDDLANLPQDVVDTCAGLIIEPLIQGVNQMHVWPSGMLTQLRQWTEQHGVHLILDEVMTGFGRTGKLFAHQHESVSPDYLCLAKGLTGGYTPLAATLTTNEIFEAFKGDGNTFYYGHSYTGHALGCSAAIANLEIFESENTLYLLQPKIDYLKTLLEDFKNQTKTLNSARQCGFVAGLEFRQPDGVAFSPKLKIGQMICEQAAKIGVLTRPILDTVVLMLPLSAENWEIKLAVHSLQEAAENTFKIVNPQI